MAKRVRSLMPPNWPPASFSGAIEEQAAGTPQPPLPADSGVNAHDPLARLDAVTATPTRAAPNREANPGRDAAPNQAANPGRDFEPTHEAEPSRDLIPTHEANPNPVGDKALVTVGSPTVALSPDAYREELEQIDREIENLRLLLLQTEREIATQSQRQELAKSEVAKIERRLQQHTHDEIRAAYAHASETEMRAFMASEQRDQMLAKLQAFERYERFLRGAITALESAPAQPLAFPGVARAPHEWGTGEPHRSSSRYASVAEDDDEYEARWMTPTSPTPAIHLDSLIADEVGDVDEGATVSVTFASLRSEVGVEPPTDDLEYEEYVDSPPDAMRSESSIPLPRPQLPDEQAPWASHAANNEPPEEASDPAPHPSQHVVVMGPQTASLDFRGEHRGQWEGAHAVLNRVVQAQEEVAERVAQQIQEVSLQALSQLALEADYFEHQAKLDPRAALTGLQQVRAQLNAALQGANSALLSIRPMSIGATSLIGALRRYAMSMMTQYNLPFELQTPDRELPLAPEAVKLAFRVGQEAMLNAARHAHASLLLISLSYASDAMRLVVEDDGVGFDAEQEVNRSIKRGAGGLLGMLERAELLDGRLRIGSTPGGGCNVELLVPLPQH
jgi:signal transduction histidine kinase